MFGVRLVVAAVVFAVGAGAGGGASNTAWQPSLNCKYFRIMQAVMRSTSGMHSPRKKIPREKLRGVFSLREERIS
jgi:hypothetical protein